MKINKLILSLIIVFALCFVAGAIWTTFYIIDNKAENFTKDYILFVGPGMASEEALDSLLAAAGPKYEKSLQRVAKKVDLAQNIKPGRYVIEPGFTSIYVARMLVNRWQTPGNMTLSGAMRSRETIAKKISLQMMVDSTAVMDSISSNEFLAKYDVDTLTVFGLILPDTYQMYWTASVTEIFDRFKKEYDKFWTDERLAKAKAQNLSPLQVSTMASIVNGETRVAAEYGTIAGVYLNRYRIGMRLQADPTIAYIHGYKLNRILKTHLTVESPFNTYKYKGLPPAPISVPPKGCIEAVLNPQKHNYLYFCASAELDGTHFFASSYSKHLRNARAFHRALTSYLKEKSSK